MLIVAEVAVNLYDVGVVKETLDLELTDELHQEVLSYYPLLFDDLEADDQARPDLASQIHASELTFSQPADDLEALL